MTAFLLTLLVVPVEASETTDNSTEANSATHGPEVKVTVGVTDVDNIFELGQPGLVRLLERDPCNLTNGRLTDMVSTSDRILSSRIALEQSVGDLLGRKATLAGDLTHHGYQDNPAASYADGVVTLTRKVGEEGRLRLRAEVTNNRFRRNYLADVDDINGNGNIPCRERQYAAGIYDEQEWSIGYRHRLTWISSERDLDIHFSGGVLRREYDQPLQNRDREGWFGQLGMDAEVTPRIAVEVAWRHDTIDAPGADETILVDEILDGDVNDDGDTERNAPLVTEVDRSKDRMTLRAEMTVKVADDWRFTTGYRYQRSDFLSGNVLDIDHFSVVETEERISASIRWRFARRWFATLTWQRTDGEDIDNLGRDQVETEVERISFSMRRRLR